MCVRMYSSTSNKGHSERVQSKSTHSIQSLYKGQEAGSRACPLFRGFTVCMSVRILHRTCDADLTAYSRSFLFSSSIIPWKVLIIHDLAQNK